MPLAPAVAERLTKLLNLSSSEYDGEALAAIRAANRTVLNAGTSWEDIVRPQIGCEQRQHRQRDSVQDDIAWCLKFHNAALTDWDRQFLTSLKTFTKFSDKQRAVLDRIIRKCRSA